MKPAAAMYGMAAGSPFVPVAPVVDQVLALMVADDAVTSATGLAMLGKKKK